MTFGLKFKYGGRFEPECFFSLGALGNSYIDLMFKDLGSLILQKSSRWVSKAYIREGFC